MFSTKKLFILLSLLQINLLFSQTSILGQQTSNINTITTSVPFLLIAPDSRSGAMGDAGVALSPDANSNHWNSAKNVFSDKQLAIALSYSPWLKALVNDINLSYLSGYYKIDDKQAVGTSLRYFSLGDITFTDINAQVIGQFRPVELAIDATYSRRLSNRFSGGLAVRFINSNLTGGINANGSDTKPGRSVGVDLSAYYENKEMKIANTNLELRLAALISNLGPKISYSESGNADFLPMNLKIGSAFTFNLDKYNSFTFTTDLNKLLVPSPPIYDMDSTGQPIYINGNPVILSGKNPDVPVATAIFQSFVDAPGVVVGKDSEGNPIIEKGSKFKEEIREINYSIGVEYWYNKQFAIRAGYFYEHPSKGNRQFFTFGVGLKYSVFGLDFAYLVPTIQNHPLANTLRFTLRFDFESFKEQNGS